MRRDVARLTMVNPTLVENAIHRSDEPRHFMTFKYPGHDIAAVYKGIEIARSRNALRLHEVGRDVYDPVVYFPKEDIHMEWLSKTAKTTHCPLKGDTQYFDVKLDRYSVRDAAWCYDRPIESADALKNYIAFDSSIVRIVEFSDTVSDS